MSDRPPHPPWVNPPRVSSSGRPGPCITPSRVTWFMTTIRPMSGLLWLGGSVSGAEGVLLLDTSPAAGAVSRDDRTNHLQQGRLVDRVASIDLDRPGGRIALALVDDAVGIPDGRVVDEDVDVVLGREQGADVALQNEVGPHRSLDRLLHFGVGGVHKLAHALADRLLPVGEPADVLVDARIGVHAHHRAAGTSTRTASTWPVGVRKSLGHWAVTM